MGTKLENLNSKSTEIVDERMNLGKTERNNAKDISSIRSVLEGYLKDASDISLINQVALALESDKQEVQGRKEIIRRETDKSVDEVDKYADALVKNLDKLKKIEGESDLSVEKKTDLTSTERRLEELSEIRRLLTDEDGVSWKSLDVQNSVGNISSVEQNSMMPTDLDYSREQNVIENEEQLNNRGVISGMIADIIAARGSVSFSLQNDGSVKSVGEKIKNRAKKFFSSTLLKQSKLDKVYTKFQRLHSDEIDAATHEVLCKTALSLVAIEFSDVLSLKQLQDATKNIYLLSDEEIVNKYPNDNLEVMENKLHSSGFYQNGEIIIRKDSKSPFLKLMKTYIHEILHMSSDNDAKSHEGFLEYRNGKICNRGINEGATELLALQILEKKGYKMFVRAYGPLVDIAEKIQSIIGENTFKNLYKKSGLQSIRNNYDWCFSRGEFDKLLNDIEKVHDIYPVEDNSLEKSIMQRLEEYEKRKSDNSYRLRKQLEVKGVTVSIKQNTTETDSDPTIGQKVKAKGYERDE